MTRAYFRHVRSSVAVLLLASSVQLAAQTPGTAADSLKAELLQQRTSLALADSVGDLHTSFEARMQLVPLVRRAESMVLLKQAAAIADSLDRPDLGAMVHRLLAKRYASTGDPAAAYVEALVVDSLDRIRELREMDRTSDEHAMMLDRLIAEQDSLAQAGLDRERRLAEAMVHVQHNADRWMMAALVAMGLGLVIVLGLFYRMGRTSRKLRTTIAGLRAEADALRPVSNRRRKTETQYDEAPSIPDSAQIKAPPTPVHEAMKPVVEGMFRKGAPERLATLRQARERGDLEKVLRVVHSLKPQLVNFDEARFASLCARLTAPGASADHAQWSADLDALDAGVSALLRTH
ncbi:MAG: Hpt domain-containing protein [Flavobacteriales bacterium]